MPALAAGAGRTADLARLESDPLPLDRPLDCEATEGERLRTGFVAGFVTDKKVWEPLALEDCADEAGTATQASGDSWSIPMRELP